MMFAPGDAGAPGDVLAVPGAESFEQLVSQVKEMQRKDVNAREQWGNYVALSGTKDRDPAKRDPAFLQNFLIQMSSGVKFQTLDDTSGAALVQAVRVLQKKSTVFKTVWTTYNSQHGKGFNDPTKHDSAYHIRFFDTMAQQACIAMGAMDPSALMIEDQGENPMKRMRDPSGMGYATAGCGGGMKEHYVNQVKHFQRLGPDQNELWGVYADTYLQGIRDPSRHDAATLQEFCVNHNVPPADGASQQVGVAVPPPAVIHPSHAYGNTMPPDQMQFAGMPPPGAYPGMAPAMPPFGMPTTVGMPAGGMMGGYVENAGGITSAGGGMPDRMTPGMLEPMDAEKVSLVDRIKTHQRQSNENREAWGAFCGKHRDPCRHEKLRLQEFCTIYGI